MIEGVIEGHVIDERPGTDDRHDEVDVTTWA